MYSKQLFLALLAALFTSAVPLNINLGAYSPALVVGDGEISFGGSAERASEVLQTLSTGALNGAVANGQPGPRPSTQGAASAVPPPQGQGQGQGAGDAAPGLSSPLVASNAQQAKAAGDPAPSNPSININPPPALQVDGNAQLPAEYISHAISGTKYPNMAKEKRDIGSSSENDTKENIKRNEVAIAKLKRDIDGFRAALQFARDAELNTPRIELGQGIIQNAGVNVPVNSAANGARPTPARGGAVAQKRDLGVAEESEKLGITLVAISEI